MKRIRSAAVRFARHAAARSRVCLTAGAGGALAGTAALGRGAVASGRGAARGTRSLAGWARPRVSWSGAALLGRILVVLAGLAALGYGLDGLLTMRRATNPPHALAWLIGGLLTHDVVVFPVIAVVGLVLTRLVRAPYRAVVQGALLVSVAVALSSLPLWRGYGGAADNPSVDPLPYGRNLGIVLGAVWAGAAVIMAVRLIRARRRRAAPPAGDPAARADDL